MTETYIDLKDVNRPTSDSENWYIIEQQSFTIDKEDFILSEFAKDFPHVKVKDFQQFELVLSRSSKLQEWYALASLKYTDSIQLPVAYKDLFKPSEYKEYFKDIQEYKSNLAGESAEIEKISAQFKKELNKIKNKFKDLNDKIIDKNKFYPIITMTGQDLPLSLQLEIEQYTPKTGEVTQQRSLYGREMLINYKRTLIEKVQADPDLDVLQLIENMKLK
jgi:hypothetical protein